jgi:hypothetical protein
MPAAVMAVSAGVLAAELLLVLLAGLAALAVARHAALSLRRAGKARAAVAMAVLGIGLLAFGGRLGVARGNVSWAPYLDQWAAEISGVAAPLAHGTLGWRDLLAGNNEHRVFLTRSLALGVILANGCWDNRVMVIANYALQAAAVAWVSLLAWSRLGWARGSYVAAAALLPMFLVCDWESIMWSNQTQFILMAFGSVFALSLTGSQSLATLAGWGSLAAALLTLGTMASGFLAPVCMAATACLAARMGRSGWRAAAGYCAVCFALAVVGWESRIPFPALEFLHAKGLGEWTRAFLAYASWPLPGNLLGLLILWLPWYVLLREALSRREAHPLAPFALGLGLWALLQACAVAWARAGLSGLVSSRYIDFLGWGVVANAAALAVIFAGLAPVGRAWRAASLAVMALWLGGVGSFELWRSANDYRPFFETYRAHTLEHERRLGSFMRTGDAGSIRGQEIPHIPYYDPEKIIATLGDKDLQPLLPGPMRRDLVRERDPSLLASVQDGPLSLLALRALENGRWFSAAGLAALAAAAWLARRAAGWPAPQPL